MNSEEKIKQLDAIIQDALPTMIGSHCVYVDLPYYANVGDVLIWEGTERFLRRNHINVVYSGSWDTFDFRPIPEEITIVMQGGGNFGDVWDPPQQFRLKVVENYPMNKIILLPQTIFYYSEERMKEDAAVFAKHPNLTICARDHDSYQLACEYFKNDVVCLPDMAFCIPVKKLRRGLKKVKNGKQLFLKRIDKEYKLSEYERSIPHNAEVHDWPTLEKEQDYLRIMQLLLQKRYGLARLKLSCVVDGYARFFLKPRLIRVGVTFLGQYERVYSTRLHGAILSVLLGKPCVFLNNSYGKNMSFYNTWFSDLEEIEFVNE